MSDTSRKAMPIREGFERLGVSHPTGYAEIHAGRLRTFKIGRRRYVTPEALDEYIAQRERESMEAA